MDQGSSKSPPYITIDLILNMFMNAQVATKWNECMHYFKIHRLALADWVIFLREWI